LWGYLPSALAIALLPVVVLSTERALRPGAGYRGLLVAAAAAMLVSWLHPWQGALLELILAGLAATGRRGDLRRLVPVALATGTPLLYYLLLAKLDPAWKLAAQNEIVAPLPPGALAAGLLPLLPLAVAGLRRPGPDLAERALLLWIPGALVLYLFLSSYPSHALESISLPLAVLTVRGARRVHLPAALAAALLAVATLPGLAYEARLFRDAASGPLQQYYRRASDARALRWVEHRAPAGGVMARTIFAIGIPAATGRSVWVGHQFWSRDYVRRSAGADALFAGRLNPGAAQALVLLSGVRVLVSDCGAGRDLRPSLAPVLAATRRFGCASVYMVRRR